MKRSHILLLCALAFCAACNNPTPKNTTPNLQVTFTDDHFRNCDRAKKYIESGGEIFADTDTMCATMRVHIPVVAGADAAVVQQINADILQSFCNNENQSAPCKTMEDIHAGFDRQAAQEGFDIDVEGAVITNANGYLALGFESEYYMFGGAHGLAAYETRNYDVHTGKRIELKDCLLPDALPKLTAIAEKQFKLLAANEGSQADNGGLPLADEVEQPFALPTDFAFTDVGLAFYYDMYEIGPGSDGLIVLKIPYAELKECIAKESVAGKWVAEQPHKE